MDTAAAMVGFITRASYLFALRNTDERRLQSRKDFAALWVGRRCHGLVALTPS